MEVFLEEIGESRPGRDPVALFHELEVEAPNLIERFFASAWRHRDEFHTPYSRRWDDLMYHGLLRPLNFIIITGLLAANPHSKLPLSERVASFLDPEDLALNLNYDLIFDVALKNIGREAVYSPHPRESGRIWAFKPHGSFHLAVNESKNLFYFGEVGFVGDSQSSDGAHNYLGFIPPRVEKSFSHHPFSQMIIAPLLDLRPEIVTFWGVGSPASDVDLFDAYKLLCSTAARIEYINPSKNDAERFQFLLGKKITHIEAVDEWLT